MSSLLLPTHETVLGSDAVFFVGTASSRCRANMAYLPYLFQSAARLVHRSCDEQAGLAQRFVDHDRYCVGEVEAAYAGFEDWDSVGADDSLGYEVSA